MSNQYVIVPQNYRSDSMVSISPADKRYFEQAQAKQKSPPQQMIFGGYSPSPSLQKSLSTQLSEQSIDDFGRMQKDSDTELVVQYILQLRDTDKREQALSELSKKRESFPHLAPLLWHSVGTIAIFLQEIAVVYQHLQPAQLTPAQSSRICSVLGLLQCLALHVQTRSCFLRAHIPLFLYPFLNTSNKSKAFENLRVTSLGVIGALVKGDDPEAINFLMQTEIIPLCLRIMKKGQELSRTVATFIVQKILLDDNGLNYICQTPERFFAVSQVLQTMIDDLHQSQKDDQRLLRHIIRCYLRLSENQKAGEVLKKYLPQVLKDPTQSFIKDEVVKKWHNNLLQNLSIK
ncbi:unnamed protein product [Paramecium primaurelia]|uniref:Cell differentiation protein rcd1 n=1 Tax=Paramecium primaurelia TaxID=5886 RepID=A0A8S1P6C8_PARPR|nr:unnamed protein product [Paramecium primaurelia]